MIINTYIHNAKTKLAFTLAEVLIVLGIIGIIAEMTIPTVMSNAQNAGYVAGLKKSISVFNSALSLANMDSGGFTGAYSNSDGVIDAFCNKLKCIKVCHSTDDRTGCFHTGSDWSKLDGSAAWGDFSSGGSNASAILSDGIMFNLSPSNFNCSAKTDVCMLLTIDVNGFKKPNKMGRDMFELYIEPTNVVPNGTQGASATGYDVLPSYCNPSITSTYNGCNCGGRIIIEGGMNY